NAKRAERSTSVADIAPGTLTPNPHVPSRAQRAASGLRTHRTPSVASLRNHAATSKRGFAEEAARGRCSPCSMERGSPSSPARARPVPRPSDISIRVARKASVVRMGALASRWLGSLRLGPEIPLPATILRLAPEVQTRPGAEGERPIAHHDVRWPCPLAGRVERHPLAADLDLEPVTAVAQPQLQPLQIVREARVEPEPVIEHLQAGLAQLDQIDRAGHGAQVDALGRGAPLDVRDVALERFLEQLPGTRPVGSRQHPGVHDLAEGRAVRGASEIIL